MRESGKATRDRILDAAEQLFAERGVSAVSLREIRIASGARNTAAVQFHFDNRKGLIKALIERHMPHIGARQAELAEHIVETDTRGLVEILVKPVMEYVDRGPSERAWVMIMAELGALPDLYLSDMSAITPEAGRKAATALYRHIEARVPRAVARERIIMMADMSVRICGVYARMVGDVHSRPHLDAADYADNLIDMLHAAVLAPSALGDDARQVRPSSSHRSPTTSDR